MRTSCKSKKLIISTIIRLLLINLITCAIAQPHICTNNGGYATNSTYDDILDALTFTLNRTISESGFSASSIAVQSEQQSAAAGLALCRADTTPAQCLTCVQSAAPAVVDLCRNQKQGVVWLDNCLARYTEAALHAPSNVKVVLVNGYEAANRAQFKADRDSLLSDIGQLAASGSSTLKAGAGRRSTTSIGTESNAIYGLVQCTPDLSAADCGDCLAGATTEIQSCCDFQLGARVLKPDCTLQYEIRSFYNETRLSERGVLLS